MFKKIIAVVTALVLCLSLVACGGEESDGITPESIKEDVSAYLTEFAGNDEAGIVTEVASEKNRTVFEYFHGSARVAIETKGNRVVSLSANLRRAVFDDVSLDEEMRFNYMIWTLSVPMASVHSSGDANKIVEALNKSTDRELSSEYSSNPNEIVHYTDCKWEYTLEITPVLIYLNVERK